MILKTDCQFVRFTEGVDISDFHCKVDDLNDFLKNDALKYSKQLMGVTYLFVKKRARNKKTVCFFTVSNDVLNIKEMPKDIKKKVNKTIHYNKQKLKHYPSVKIGRLGVSESYKGLKVGKQLMDFIKLLFITKNRTGCRFVLVDAYNDPNVLQYYKDNEFDFLVPSEIEEAKLTGRENSLSLKTRIMYFDLMSIS